MTTDDDEVRAAVIEALNDYEDFDVEGIARELIASYDLIGDRPTTSVARIPSEEFWAIVERHDRSAANLQQPAVPSRQDPKLHRRKGTIRLHSFDWTDPETGAVFTIHHNGDYSGEVIIDPPPSLSKSEIHLPAELLAAFSRAAAIGECISALEQLY